jgi:hypothetical protein
MITWRAVNSLCKSAIHFVLEQMNDRRNYAELKLDNVLNIERLTTAAGGKIIIGLSNPFNRCSSQLKIYTARTAQPCS